MSRLAVVDVQFRLTAPVVPGAVHVRMRSFGERWVAVASIDEDRQSGMGADPRQALDAALGHLPASIRTALVADLALLGPSIEIARQAADASHIV